MKENKTATYVMLAIAGAIILFMVLEGLFNAFGTFYGQNAAAAGGGWKFVGIALLVGSVVVASISAKSPKGITAGGVVLAGVLLVLAFCAFAGFTFDIA
jgi:hypothetical protein